MSNHDATGAHNPEKYEAILAEAIRTFADEGFRNADVQVIAGKAGVGKGTVYRYFGNKEELFWATTYCVLERLRAHLFQAMREASGPLETLRRAGPAYAGFFETHPRYLEVFVQNRAEFRGSVPDSHKQFHEEMIGVFAKVLEQGIADGEIRPVDVRQTIMSLASMFYGAVMFGCYVKDEHSLTELAEHTANTFLDGIRAKATSGQGGNSG